MQKVGEGYFLRLRRVVECSSTNVPALLTTTRVRFLVLKYSAAKQNKNLSRPTLTRARESGGRWHGTVGKKCFPTQVLSNSPLRNWDQMSWFLIGLGGKWIILPSLVFKTALFTVIIIIKSAPSTATQSKIACVFGDGPGILFQWYGGGKKKKNQQKSTKINNKNQQKLTKKLKKTWRPNIRVFACKPGSVPGYLITLLCTALVQMLRINTCSARGQDALALTLHALVEYVYL